MSLYDLAHDGWLYTFIITAAGNSISSQLGRFSQGSPYGTEKVAGAYHIFTYFCCPCRHNYFFKKCTRKHFQITFSWTKNTFVRLMDTIWTLRFSKRGEGHVPILTHFVGSHPLPPHWKVLAGCTIDPFSTSSPPYLSNTLCRGCTVKILF